MLDRFWVLERSVDIDGADFIIQRRLTSRNLLDRDAPRFGVVQVKFFGTEKTTHYVHKEYVMPRGGGVRSEFFLLCHCGGPEDPRMFLISGEDIQKEFNVIEKDGSERFRLGYEDVCNCPKFLVTNRKLALDRIENAMALADFLGNRRFMSWVLPDPRSEMDAILPEYREPIKNDWGDLPEEFRRIKEAVRSDLFRIEEVYEILARILEEADPIAAAKLVEDAAYFCRGGTGFYRWGISLKGEYDDEDFFSECRRHIFIVQGLKDLGLLDSFIELKNELKSRIVSYLKDKIPLDKGCLHVFLVEFDVEHFKILSCTSEIVREEDVVKRLEEAGEELKERWRGGIELPEVREMKPGFVRGIWSPHQYSWGNPEDETPTIEHFKNHDFRIYRECVNYLLHKKFPEEFEWPT